MAEMNINIDFESVFLRCYHHLLNDGKKYNSKFFDIEFLYGGRDSGKSRHVAMQLLIACMLLPYFKCMLIRKVLNSVRESQFSLLCTLIEDWQLDQLFSINHTRMEIIFIPNGNGFYARGLDKVDKIKSFNNPSHCWIEEGNQIEKDDFVVILTSLRANQRVQTFFTFNPECEVNYTEFWLYDEWFSHTTELSWTWNKSIEVKKEIYDRFPDRVYLRNGKYFVDQQVRATHTTYNDNPYCAPERIALYESYKDSKNNAYWYQTYTLGLWGYKRTGQEFWKCFDEVTHTTSTGYQPGTTLHIVADNNVNPYIALQIWQVFREQKLIRQVFELPCRHPENTASKAAIKAARLFERIDYNDIVFIYGDPSANAKSTTDDDGRSFFDKFISKLTQEGVRIINRVQKSAPEVALSGAFVNEIYESNYHGWTIEINVDCRVSIEDYIMAKEDAEGKILKKRIKDKDTEVTFEKYGHFSDDKRYFITTILNAEFNIYKQRRKKYYGV